MRQNKDGRERISSNRLEIITYRTPGVAPQGCGTWQVEVVNFGYQSSWIFTYVVVRLKHMAVLNIGVQKWSNELIRLNAFLFKKGE